MEIIEVTNILRLEACITEEPPIEGHALIAVTNQEPQLAVLQFEDPLWIVMRSQRVPRSP